MRGNLADLAKLGLASEPPLADWLKSLPAETEWIFKRATAKGDPWDIDLAAAVVAWNARQDEKTQAARDRADLINQLALDLGLNPRPETHSDVSINERKALLEEEVLAIKLAEKRGELIRKRDVEAAAADAMSKHRSSFESLAAELAMKLDLDRDQIAIVEKSVSIRLHAFADDMENLGRNDGNDGAATAAAMENSGLLERA
jgi:hypothetical protein